MRRRVPQIRFIRQTPTEDTQATGMEGESVRVFLNTDYETITLSLILNARRSEIFIGFLFWTIEIWVN